MFVQFRALRVLEVCEFRSIVFQGETEAQRFNLRNIAEEEADARSDHRAVKPHVE